MTLSWVLVLVFASWAIGLSAYTVKDRRGRRRMPDPSWRVTTTPYREHVVQRGYGDPERIDVTRKVQVRVGKGADSLVIATVSIDADDFEDLISDAQAVAQTKAASLNAYLGSGS